MCDRCLKCSDQISAQSKSIVHLQQAEGTVDARTRKWETTALIHMFHFTEENYSNHDDVAFVVPDKHPENETRRPGCLFYFNAALSHVSPSAQTLHTSDITPNANWIIFQLTVWKTHLMYTQTHSTLLIKIGGFATIFTTFLTKL